MSTIPPPVTDAELDRPDIRAAARAVVDDLTTADVEPLDDRHVAVARRRPRLAIAAAAAAIAVGTGLAGYALAAGSDEPRAVMLDPSSAPGQAAPPAPADVCEAVTNWLSLDVAGDARGAELAHAQLVAYRDRAQAGGDEDLAGRLGELTTAIQSGDRLAAEAAASEGFGGDACA